MNRSFKLGKKLGKVEDPRSLRAQDIIKPKVAAPPPKHTVAYHADIEMFGNAKYGDCTCAAMGHRIRCQERSVAQSAHTVLTDGDVLGVYSAVTGFDPARPETDQGAYLLDVLRYMRKNGMGTEKDGTPHTVYAYAEVDVLDHDQVMLAHYLFGGLYIGVGLPEAAQDQIGSPGSPGHWTITGDPRADKWGSWGGHCMYVQGYDAKAGVQFDTWGMWQYADWAWWDAYVDEAWAVVSEDYLRTHTQETPQGYDQAALTDLLKSL